MKKILFFIILVNSCVKSNAQVTDLPEILKETPEQHKDRMSWWHDAKFGMFIHWGLYSVIGRGEWVMWNEQISVDEYAKQSNKFNADKYDPEQWAALAKEAGMNYMVLTH